MAGALRGDFFEKLTIELDNWRQWFLQASKEGWSSCLRLVVWWWHTPSSRGDHHCLVLILKFMYIMTENVEQSTMSYPLQINDIPGTGDLVKLIQCVCVHLGVGLPNIIGTVCNPIVLMIPNCADDTQLCWSSIVEQHNFVSAIVRKSNQHYAKSLLLASPPLSHNIIIVPWDLISVTNLQFYTLQIQIDSRRETAF